MGGSAYKQLPKQKTISTRRKCKRSVTVVNISLMVCNSDPRITERLTVTFHGSLVIQIIWSLHCYTNITAGKQLTLMCQSLEHSLFILNDFQIFSVVVIYHSHFVLYFFQIFPASLFSIFPVLVKYPSLPRTGQKLLSVNTFFVLIRRHVPVLLYYLSCAIATVGYLLFYYYSYCNI